MADVWDAAEALAGKSTAGDVWQQGAELVKSAPVDDVWGQGEELVKQTPVVDVGLKEIPMAEMSVADAEAQVRAQVPQPQAVTGDMMGRAQLDMTPQPAKGFFDPLVETPKMSTQEMLKALPKGTSPYVADILSGGQSGAAKFVEGMTSPFNLALTAASGSLARVPGVGPAIQRVASAAFGLMLTKGAAEKSGEAVSDIMDEDYHSAAEKITGGSLEGLAAVMAAGHAVKGVVADSPRMQAILRSKIREEYSPEQIKAILNKANLGEASPVEMELVQMLNAPGFQQAGAALKEGAAVVTSAPRVSPGTAEFLGMPGETTRGIEIGGKAVEPPQGSAGSVAGQLGTQEEPSGTTAAVPAPAPEPVLPPKIEPPTGGEMQGGDATAVKGTGGQLWDAKYVAMPIDRIQASHVGENFSANEGFGPVKNTRDYGTELAEAEKVVRGSTEWDPAEHVTDSISAASGPIVTAEMTWDQAGKPRTETVVLGGNGRLQMLKLQDAAKLQETTDLFNDRRQRFGISKPLGKGEIVTRYLGQFDLRQPGELQRVNGIVDALNPSPGLIQSVAKMAEVDAAQHVPVQDIAALDLNVSPVEAQAQVRGLISKGYLDPNLRTGLSQVGTVSQDYVQRLMVNKAFRSPKITDTKMDLRTEGNWGTLKGLIQVATPSVLRMRVNSADAEADSIRDMLENVIGYMNTGNTSGRFKPSLERAAGQLEMGGESTKVVNDLAQALQDEVVLGKNDRINASETVDNFESFFGDIQRALNHYSPVADMFGTVESVGMKIRAAIEARKRMATEGATLREGENGWKDGGQKRLAELRKVRLERPLTRTEHGEVEELEKALGQNFMEFFTDEMKRKGEELMKQREQVQQGMDIEARLKAKLTGQMPPSQLDLFRKQDTLLETPLHYGPPTPEEARAYATRVGADSPREVEEALRRGWGDAVRSPHGYALCDAGGGLPSAPGKPLQGFFVNGEPVKAEDWLDNRISAVMRGQFTGKILSWDIRGKVIASTQDLILLRMGLRNPWMEVSTVTYMDAQGKVLASEASTMGLVNQSPFNMQSVVTRATMVGAKTISFIHNHPSGKPEPSTEDVRSMKALGMELRKHGMELKFHANTNGKKFYDYETHGTVDLPERLVKLQPWELVDMDKLNVLLHTKEKFLEVWQKVHADQGMVHVVGANSKLFVQALRRFPVKDFMTQDPIAFGKAVADAAWEDGTMHVFLIFPDWMDKPRIREWSFAVSRALEPINGQLMDVAWKNDTFMAGMNLASPPSADQGEFTFKESESDYNRSGVEVELKDGTTMPQELAQLDKIRIVEMPELVKLVKELTGSLPNLKQLRRFNGYFKGGGPGKVTLDWRIFRQPSQAARTLAHELGHLMDYLPDRALDRGNLLGRLGTLRGFMSSTIDKAFLKSGISEKERLLMRKQAQDQVGKRPKKEDATALAAWKQDVAKGYQDRMNEWSKNNKLTTNEQVYEELYALTSWWRPWDPSISPSYNKYRESSVELYADALSVLFNAPVELKAKAPVFWEKFFELVDRKPEVKQALIDVQEMLSRGAKHVLEARKLDIDAMFGKGEEIFLRKSREQKLRHEGLRGFRDRIMTGLMDVFDPITRKQRALEAQGKTIPAKDRVDWLFEEHPLGDNVVYRFLEKMWGGVVKPVEAAGMTMSDIGEYLFLDRILNERVEVEKEIDGQMQMEVSGRSTVANPLGITPDIARLQLMRMNLDHGIRKMTLLRSAVAKFHDLVFDVMKDAQSAGLINKETFDKVIAPNRQHYAAFVPLKYVDTWVPSGIYQQRGTLEESANPLNATVLKAITLHRAIQYQKAKQGTVNFLQQYFPQEIAASKTHWTGSRMQPLRPKDPEKALFEVRQNGKVVGYDVEKSIAEMFEEIVPAKMLPVVDLLNWSFKKIFYPLFITYNPFFQFFSNPVRDFRKMVVNAPGKIGMVKLTGSYLRGLKDAADRTAGRQNDLVNEMVDNMAIGTPFDTFNRGLSRHDAFEAILQKFHLLPEEQQPGWLSSNMVKPVRALLDTLAKVGQVFEGAPKIGTYRVLRKELGWSPQEAGAYIRNHVGVPNFMRRGRWSSVAGSMMPFIQVFLNGYRDDIRLATGKVKGKSSGSWWMRWMLVGGGTLAVIKALAELGFLGDDAKKILGGASTYDKTNYEIIPVGTMEGGQFGEKSVYLRIPQDESHRILNGMIYRSLLLAGKRSQNDATGRWSDLLAFGEGQLPGMSPVLKIASNWADYAAGLNPQNRGRSVLTNDEFLAGGWESLKPMLSMSMNESGLGNFVRVDPRANTTVETAVNLTPILNRILKISDFGHREAQMDSERLEDQSKAGARLLLPDNVKQLSTEYHYLRGLGQGDRTPVQEGRFALLSQWYTSIYKPSMDAVYQIQDKGMDTKAIIKSVGESSKAWELKQ